MSAAPEETPLPERILDAAENALRRYGQEKTNVVDIARALGMSHGNIYRHFSNKKELLKAVTARWLEKVTGPLDAIASDGSRSATERMVAWFAALRTFKRAKVTDDPELFRAHYTIAAGDQELGQAHVSHLQAQVQRIISDGMERGEFSRRLDAAATARSFLIAMSAFHHPLMILHNPYVDDSDAPQVLELLLAGLKS